MIARLARCWSDSGETFDLIQDPEGDFVTYDDHRAALAEKERFLEQQRTATYQAVMREQAMKKLLNEKEREMAKAKAKEDVRRYERDWLEASDQVLKLRADLDQVIGEAVQCVTFLASPYIDDSMRQTAQETFMGHPIVQSWKARQATAPCSLAADLHKGRLADEEAT